MSDRHIRTLFVYIISNFRELTLLDNLRELIAKAVNDFIMKVNVDRSILLQDKYLSPSNKINLLDNNIPTHKLLTFEITIGAEPKPTSLRISYNFQSAN